MKFFWGDLQYIYIYYVYYVYVYVCVIIYTYMDLKWFSNVVLWIFKGVANKSTLLRYVDSQGMNIAFAGSLHCRQ